MILLIEKLGIGSMVDGRDVWVRSGELVPKFRLEADLRS